MKTSLNIAVAVVALVAGLAVTNNAQAGGISWNVNLGRGGHGVQVQIGRHQPVQIHQRRVQHVQTPVRHYQPVRHVQPTPVVHVQPQPVKHIQPVIHHQPQPVKCEQHVPTPVFHKPTPVVHPQPVVHPTPVVQKPQPKMYFYKLVTVIEEQAVEKKVHETLTDIHGQQFVIEKVVTETVKVPVKKWIAVRPTDVDTNDGGTYVYASTPPEVPDNKDLKLVDIR